MVSSIEALVACRNDPHYVRASFGVALLSIGLGYLFGRYILKLNWILLAGALCGAMTSTPGLGAAVDATGCDDVATGYGAVYPIALLSMVFFTILLSVI